MSSIKSSNEKIFGYDIDYILNLDFRSKEGKKIKLETLKKSSYLKKLALKIKNKQNISRRKILKNTINYYSEYNKSIIKIQSIVRGYIQRYQDFLRGPSFYNRKISVNEVDFFTIEKISKININYFFSFKDNDNFVYSFDIRSLSKLFETKNFINPFNRKKFSDKTINKYQNRIKQLNALKIKIRNFEEIELDEETKYRQKVISVFQKMDELGHYTDVKWFTDLKKKQLRDWYKYAEDIFNYRANLTLKLKKKIIPNNNAFPYSVDYIYKQNLTTKKLRSICLDEINKFVSNGISKDDKYTGSLYMLTALTQVSQNAAESLFWLIQPP